MNGIGDVLSEIASILEKNKMALYAKGAELAISHDKGKDGFEVRRLEVDYIGDVGSLVGYETEDFDTIFGAEDSFNYTGEYYGQCD